MWNGPEEMAIEQVPEPVVEPGTVIVGPGAAGLCDSEVEGYLGNRTPPLVMGHEFAGTVAEVGEGVSPSWSEKRRRSTRSPRTGGADSVAPGIPTSARTTP